MHHHHYHHLCFIKTDQLNDQELSFSRFTFFLSKIMISSWIGDIAMENHRLACLKANSSAGGCDKSVSSEFSADLMMIIFLDLDCFDYAVNYLFGKWIKLLWANLLGERLGLRFLSGLFCFRKVRELIRGLASYEKEFCLKCFGWMLMKI